MVFEAKLKVAFVKEGTLKKKRVYDLGWPPKPTRFIHKPKI